MAEIPIERKPRSKAGAIVLLLILVLVAVGAWYWWSQRSTTATPQTTGSLSGAGAALVAYSATLFAELPNG